MSRNLSKKLFLLFNFRFWWLTSVHSALTSKYSVLLERIFFAVFWLLPSQFIQYLLSLEFNDYKSQIFLLIASLVRFSWTATSLWPLFSFCSSRSFFFCGLNSSVSIVIAWTKNSSIKNIDTKVNKVLLLYLSISLYQQFTGKVTP